MKLHSCRLGSILLHEQVVNGGILGEGVEVNVASLVSGACDLAYVAVLPDDSAPLRPFDPGGPFAA